MNNPILPGFNPDPSILRVGDDFYIATSTFQWFPGVRIHHSRDLKHWRLLTRALDRQSQLDMRGLPDSAGIWAPCLSYCAEQKLFYLIYTIVQSRPGYLSDAPNYVVTAEDPAGPWSEPTLLNVRGFDSSLFHDDDGRKWFLQMQWDHRPGKNPFSGILLQEFDAKTRTLIGPSKNIYQGTARGLVEGPHLYRRNGYYYLMTAEGGTSFEHAVTVARSKTIDGPYETDPMPHMLSALESPETLLQKCGHASLVQTQTDEWYLAHLSSRPIGEHRRCLLGRETSLQNVTWSDDGWPRLTHGSPHGGHAPAPTYTPPQLPECPWPENETDNPAARNGSVINFFEATLPAQLDTLREPADPSWLSLSERPGCLRLRGRHSLQAFKGQSVVGRRVTAHRCSAQTRLEFAPEHFQQLAGLIAYYDTLNHYYLHITHDESLGRCLRMIASDRGRISDPLGDPIALPAGGPIWLGADLDDGVLQFRYSLEGGQNPTWHLAGPELDGTILSDDYAADLGFTGMYFGLAAQDLTGGKHAADFHCLNYKTQSDSEAPIVVMGKHKPAKVSSTGSAPKQ